MDYYDKKKRLAKDLKDWLDSNDPLPFDEFARVLLLRYGFSRRSIERTLRDEFGLIWDDGNNEFTEAK